MDLLNNQWVIGIGTSIISGLLVFFFTRKFFTEKQKEEYLQKIRTANNEILYAIRPLIVEKTKPGKEILESVFISISKKYGLDLSDIYDIPTLCDDLISEIMSNSFLSSEQKINLSELINNMRGEKLTTIDTKGDAPIRQNQKKSISSDMSFILSLMTAMIALTISITIGMKDIDLFKIETNSKFPEYFITIFIATLIPITALIMTTVLKYFRNKEIAKVSDSITKIVINEPISIKKSKSQKQQKLDDENNK